jgi:hypothetical protein
MVAAELTVFNVWSGAAVADWVTGSDKHFAPIPTVAVLTFTAAIMATFSIQYTVLAVRWKWAAAPKAATMITRPSPQTTVWAAPEIVTAAVAV